MSVVVLRHETRFYFFSAPALALMGLTLCCTLLWSQTVRFRNSVEDIAEDVRVSLIDLEGKVVYDSTGKSLPNHSARAEFEAVLADWKARSIVRESETLHMAMFYHARRVGDYVLRIAVPYQAVTDAKIYRSVDCLPRLVSGLWLFWPSSSLCVATSSVWRDCRPSAILRINS